MVREGNSELNAEEITVTILFAIRLQKLSHYSTETQAGLVRPINREEKMYIPGNTQGSHIRSIFHNLYVPRNCEIFLPS